MKEEFEYQEEILVNEAINKVVILKNISDWEVDSKQPLDEQYTKVIFKRKINNDE